MKQRILQDKYKLWYMLCFLMLGLIDQRRGSAVGEIQMIFSNLTGIVIAMLVFPSLEAKKFKEKIYKIWTPICVIITVAACALWKHFWLYQGQWTTAVVAIAIWSYILIYIATNWKSMEILENKKQPLFLLIFLMLILMVLSAHEKCTTLWYLLLFGGFFVVGIPEAKRKDFITGMLDGIIVWFFIQQIIAFGFRPYDYARYRGLYSGETQNGIFYMVVFCAFLVKWLWAKEENAKWWIRFFYFLMAAGNISFLFYTGSRSGLLGALLVTIILVTKYDIFLKKSFYRWMLHGVTMVVCVGITLPVVYGCIRYLPTILHHPIWFDGEYVEGKSVRSFDPWDSDKYITFGEAIDDTVGRIIWSLGINYNSLRQDLEDKYSAVLTVHAQELGEPGSSPDNVFMLEDVDPNSGDQMWARKVIYTYYWNHLNFRGHRTEGQGFYTIFDRHYTHAHNMFLQMAYDYGILTGIVFVIVYLYALIRALRKNTLEGWTSTAFLIAIFCFGLLEMVLTPGQITIPLMWIMFYFVGEGSKKIK